MPCGAVPEAGRLVPGSRDEPRAVVTEHQIIDLIPMPAQGSDFSPGGCIPEPDRVFGKIAARGKALAVGANAHCCYAVSVRLPGKGDFSTFQVPGSDRP